MLDHIGFTVADGDASKTFYDAALKPLGIVLMMTVGEAQAPVYGYGRDKPELWFGADGRPMASLHLAVAARSRAEVDGFHAAALAAGGRDNGGPGLRPQYHPNYYAAFVLDPDGNNLEAVFHGPA